MTVSIDSPILAPPRSTAERASAVILAREHGEYTAYDISQVIIPAYFRIAQSVGVDPIVAIAQMIHETGNLTSWWSQRPRRNPAGIGVTGATAKTKPSGGSWQFDGTLWREGLAYADWIQMSIPSHIGRLLAYAIPKGQGTPAQQSLIAYALSHRPLPDSYRGAALTLRGLNGRWAVPGTTYADRIAAIANGIIGTVSRLDSLPILDMSDQIAALPRRRDAQKLPLRTGPEIAITLHYSGVIYSDRSRTAELRRIIDEATYHLNKNWGTSQKPVYGDRMMYEYVILSDGTIVRTQREAVQLWHAGNQTANERSYSVHWMLGPGQDLTPTQRASTVALLDALRAERNLPRSAVYGHNEWPRTLGAPLPSNTYRVLPQQSECPGLTLHRFIVQYRAGQL